MPTKTLVKKTKKSPRQTKGVKTSGFKPAKKTPKKITLDGSLKIQDEIWAAIEENHIKIFGIKGASDIFYENIMSPHILKKFKKFGFSFDILIKIKFAQGVYAEISALYDNCIQAIIVVVTNTLQQADIDEHLERMEKIQKYANEHGDNRHFMGAMATLITDENAKNYALKKGLFIIEPSGEDVKVTKPEAEPRVW